MKNFIYKYWFLTFFVSLFGFSACTDQLIVEQPETEKTESDSEFEGFDVFIENSSKRTRDIEFTPGATVKMNAVWIGVFDFEGNRVAQQHTVQDYTYLTSGQESPRALRIDYAKLVREYPAINTNRTKDYFIVVVANYSDVKGKRAGDAELSDLKDLLTTSDTWQKFNEIGVDTKTAYADSHNLDTPLMAGFLNSKKSYQANVPSSTHIKIDQFKGSGGVHLTPETFLSGAEIMSALKVHFATFSATDFRFVSPGENTLQHTVFFRRLVSNINVNISVHPDSRSYIKITDVQYRRFNVPNSVYIIERTMIDTREGTNKGKFPTEKEYSPNFSDLEGASGYWADDDALKDKEVSKDPNKGETEEDKDLEAQLKKNWQNQTVREDQLGNWTFNFQHFANKHWARGTNLEKYADREKAAYDSNGKLYFTALADNAEDINNNATYFVIRMHIVDTRNKRCAEAEYIIHEGYTSNSDGSATTTETERLKDFSCARNIDYYYNIQVYGIENIFVNVGQSSGLDSEENPLQHRHDMGGRVWNMIYANDIVDGEKDANFIDGKFENVIDWEGGIFPEVITIKALEQEEKTEQNESIYKFNTDFAFRLYGYDSKDGVIKAYNYNFPQQSFTWLDGMWPAGLDNANYYAGYQALIDEYEKETSVIDVKLFNAFKIIDAAQYDEGRQNDFENFDRELDRNGQPQNNDETGEDKRDKNYWMDIVQFIEHLNNLNNRTFLTDTKKYHIYVEKREIAAVDKKDKDNYIRALFLGDRNGITDYDNCSTLVNIIATVQDPPLKQ